MNPKIATPPVSWLGRVTLAILSIPVIIAGLTIATTLLLILLTVGLLLGGWAWWQFRRAIQQARQQARQQAPEILDGEFTVEPEIEPEKDVIDLHKLPAPETTATIHSSSPQTAREAGEPRQFG